MSEIDHDWADRIGRQVSIVFVVCLGAVFAYAYLGRLSSADAHRQECRERPFGLPLSGRCLTGRDAGALSTPHDTLR